MKITATANTAEVEALLRRLVRKVEDMGPAMHEIGQRYERRVLENFEREQAPDGTRWPRLSATTLMLGLTRKKGFGKSKGLVQKGRLYLQNKSRLVESGRLRSRIHYQANATGVRIGVTGIEYAAIHQFGGMAGRKRKVKIPARPYLAMNEGKGLALAERDRQMVIEILKRHLASA